LSNKVDEATEKDARGARKGADAETEELVGVELRQGWNEWKPMSRHKARMARQHE
jgi:hypothetical protein